ncbi:hypothetical protein [Paenibacillus chitinolyticus]|uniref:hypothetical protein n=1 Tax=Paenibacillus chitinolyticus TaxID=79263 RepID=UPI00366B0342
MKRIISSRLAGNLLLLLNTGMLLVHVLILLKVIPSHFIWGGRINGESELVALESVSVVIQIVFIALIALKTGYLLPGRFKRTARIGLWLLFVFMVLNTAGNLASISGPEKLFMTPLTVVLAFLSLRLAVEK